MRTGFVAVLGATLLWGAASSAGAATLAFDPSDQAVSVGSTVSVAVVVSGLGAGVAPSLSTFDLDLTFDGGVMSFLSFTFGDPILGDQLDLAGLGSITDTTAGAGAVNVFELSVDSAADLDALQASAFTLGTLRFTASSAGASSLGITINALGDANGDSLSAGVGAGRVAVVGVVPVSWPAPLLLLLIGAVGFAGFRVRRSGRAPLRPIAS